MAKFPLLLTKSISKRAAIFYPQYSSSDESVASICRPAGSTVGEAEIELTTILIGRYCQWCSAAAAVATAAKRDCLVDGGGVSP